MTWTVDPLADPRLINIPVPLPDPTPNKKSFKTVHELSPIKHYAMEILSAISGWGHLSTPLVRSICPRISSQDIDETLDTLYTAGILRKYVDCLKCKEIEIWALRPSQALKKVVASASEKSQIGFFGSMPDNKNPTDYCALPKLAKHDLAAAALAERLASVLPAGWIFGARDAQWSTLLRYPTPKIGATAFRQTAKTGQIQRWADFVYVKADGTLRVAVEVTVTQNKTQLAGKARWWGVSIAARGGYDKAGLYVVILDAPGKDYAGKSIASAFPASSGWDRGYRSLGMEAVLSAKWEEWVKDDMTPAGENGWRAYQHTTASKKKVLLTGQESFPTTNGWDIGPRYYTENKMLKGFIPVASERRT